MVFTAVNAKGLQEFDTLLKAGWRVDVTVDGIYNPDTPDSIFPNNWVSKMEMWHYSMFAENRRQTRLMAHELKKGSK
jgi:hypothetical protein